MPNAVEEVLFLFGAVLIVVVIVVYRALSSILESTNKLHMLLRENKPVSGACRIVR